MPSNSCSSVSFPVLPSCWWHSAAGIWRTEEGGDSLCCAQVSEDVAVRIKTRDIFGCRYWRLRPTNPVHDDSERTLTHADIPSIVVYPSKTMPSCSSAASFH